MSAAEEWRPVAGYESLYSISSLGRVRSEQKMIVRKNGKNYQAQERIMRPGSGVQQRYLSVRLSKNGAAITRYVHHLVMGAFGDPKPHGQEICHRDGDARSNTATNLRWGTRKENHADKKLHGTTSAGERHHGAKLTDQLVTALRARRMQGATFTTLSQEFNVTRMTAHRAATGQSWSHIK